MTAAKAEPEALTLTTPTGVADKPEKGERTLKGLYVVTFVLGIGIWTLSAMLSRNALIPSPIDVIASFAELMGNGTLWGHTVVSLGRVTTGFVLGVAVAIPAGFLMGWYWLARGLLEPWVQFFRTIPPLALIPLVIVIPRHRRDGQDLRHLPRGLPLLRACHLPGSEKRRRHPHQRGAGAGREGRRDLHEGGHPGVYSRSSSWECASRSVLRGRPSWRRNSSPRQSVLVE